MIEIEVTGGAGPEALAELIASTLQADPNAVPESAVAQTGKLVRDQQVLEEVERPSWQQMETLNFTTIEPESDWTEV